MPLRRVGVVPYINVLPLLDGLAEDLPGVEWVRDTPRRLGEMLQRQELDAAIVSSIEGLRRGYRLLPGAMIGSDGPVRSVAIFSQRPIRETTTLLLDPASLTSIELGRIVLRGLYQIEPTSSVADRPFDRDATPYTDAALLVIGDTALAWEHRFPHRLDLGAAWQQLTGLPFVFAAWWIRPEVQVTDDEIAAFRAARIRGTARIPQIIDALPADQLTRLGGRESVRQYLTQAIRYDLGERELTGLRRFEEMLGG
jgi:chorismate dehydratase